MELKIKHLELDVSLVEKIYTKKHMARGLTIELAKCKKIVNSVEDLFMELNLYSSIKSYVK